SCCARAWRSHWKNWQERAMGQPQTDSELMTLALAVMRPPPKMTVSQWADRYRKLASENSPEPGQWRTSRTPYLREVMDSVADPRIHTTVMIKSAQVGWTEVLLNVLGFYMDQDPSPIMMLLPTLEIAEGFSKERLPT